MPRPRKCRLIAAEPPVSAFKPAGVPGRTLESIELGLDELEALRLADLEGLYHDAAAQRMGISRPTFGRLVECARRKVACALFQSKMLIFRGGPIMLVTQRTFTCTDCGARFQKPHGIGRPTECPHCHGTRFHRVSEERGRGRGAPARGRGTAGRGPGAAGRGRGAPGRSESGDIASSGRGRCRRRRAGRSIVVPGADAAGPAPSAAASKTQSEVHE